MHRKLNLKPILWTLAALVPAGIGIHFVHGYQVQRNARSLLARGDAAAAKDHFDAALADYARYLGIVPNDLAAQEKYVRLLDRVAGPADQVRVVMLMQQLLLARPELHDLRFRLVHNLIAVGRTADAEHELETLSGHWDKPAELKHMLGWCQEARAQYLQAVESFRAAIELDPNRQGSYELLAEVQSEKLGDVEAARQTLDEMIAANPKAYGAFLIRARFHLRHNDPADADKDLQTALQLAPDQPEVLLAAADRLVARGKADEAWTLLEGGVRNKPREAELYKAMADLKLRANDRAAAIDVLSRGLEKLSESVDLLTPQIDLRIDLNQLDEAAQQLKALRKRAPTSSLADFLQARLLIAQGRWPQATPLLVRCRKDIALTSPWSPRIDELLGLCIDQALQTGGPDRMRTLAAELRPLEGAQGRHYRYVTAAIQLVEAGVDSTRLAEARKNLVELERQFPAWTRLSLLQARAAERDGNLEEAARHYEHAVEFGELHPAVVQRLVELLAERREYLRAEEAIGRFAAKRPLTPALTRLAAEVAAGNRNAALAHARAARIVTLPSRDYRDYLWLARLHELLSESEEAEPLLREAVRLADHVPQTWIALVEHLAKTNPAAAEEVLAQARQKVPADYRSLTLARCHEALEQFAQAEAEFDKALSAHPNDFVTLAQAADYFVRRNRADRAEPLLRHLLSPAVAAPAAQAEHARRQLALLGK